MIEKLQKLVSDMADATYLQEKVQDAEKIRIMVSKGDKLQTLEVPDALYLAVKKGILSGLETERSRSAQKIQNWPGTPNFGGDI